MRRRVTIVNDTAAAKAYAEDRRSAKDEAQRTIFVTAPTISHINGAVQERMIAEGFQRNEWKVLAHEESAGDD